VLGLQRGRGAVYCASDETLIAAYCISQATEITSSPIIIPPRGARCIGVYDPMVVITCGKL
jgi:hypothetical protein